MAKELIAKKLDTIPKRPGVYIYTDAEGTVLYVGKALSLKDRISSYLQKDVPQKTAEMLVRAVDINWIETGSDFEALLLEAKLIKLHRPKYNVTFRDDKSYLYIFISTGEEFPKVFLTRKPKNFEPSESDKYELFEDLKGEYFGPFPSAGTARSVLKWLRRALPFCTQKGLTTRACFYSHLGLCKPCPSFTIKQIEPLKSELKKQYRKNLFHLRDILRGDIATTRKELLAEMKELAKEEQFEQAAQKKRTLEQIEWILSHPPSTDVFLENPNFYAESQRAAIDELGSVLKEHGLEATVLERIECYDISTLGGTLSVAAQVVFIQGIPEKNHYRRYRIQNDGKPNDYAMLAEAITRRFKHQEWQYPDLLIIDGGKGQVSTVLETLKKLQIHIPVIGLAKQYEKIIVPHANIFIEIALPRKSNALQLMQQMRDEAHRFGLTYQRKRRSLV